MKNLWFLLAFLFSAQLGAQEMSIDSILPVSLDDVIVISKKKTIQDQQKKPLATLDEYLEQSGKITMLARGSYAWEPLLNSMGTERSVVTIDGMRIFGACTDKMDPITAYVEISNLSDANIASGQQGSVHGATIGGSIDLKRKRSGFKNNGWQFGLSSGYETNGNRKVLVTDLNYSAESFFIDTDFMFRDSENYKAGGNVEVPFSQFRKMNFSATSGFAFDKNKLMEASIIYDKATDVGYPALPMDVSLAEAFIGSIKYEMAPAAENLHNWETKLYYNSITHIMDDSQRPDVPIRMDMPGWSDTFGMYSTLEANLHEHHLKFNLNAFYNRSLAEMTMYPNNPAEEPMFMYTWGDIRTLYSGLAVEDHFYVNQKSSLQFTLSAGLHSNRVASEAGLQSLQIFYPEMQENNNRFLGSLAANYTYKKDNFSFGGGLGYGERAPSVSEGYGFYLFNSFDRFDYIGNPLLENERSVEANAFFGFKNHNFNGKISTSYFHIMDYIIGIPDENFSPMTIGANGVKVYAALDHARIFNLDWNASYKINYNWQLNAQLVYALGRDNTRENLPFISPLSYRAAINFHQNKFHTDLQVKGNATQTSYSRMYGEDRTPAFTVLDCSGKYIFQFEKSELISTIGVENIFDTYYSTFADWNNIPRIGRNFFVNLSYNF